MKKIAILSMLSVSLILSACASKERPEIIPVKSGYKIDNIHGVGVANDGTTYVATHEGLFSTKGKGIAWNRVGAADNDFMGFHLRSDGVMITSGHPGHNLDIPNPIGVLTSKDNGLHWKKVKYGGQIDFHILTSDYHDPKIIYGLNQMGTGQYGSGIYKSTDNGIKWTKIEPKGLPSDLTKVFSLLVLPDDKNALLAGTQMGVMISKDGGANWDVFDPLRLITAMTLMPNGKDIIGYSMTSTVSGLMISKDNGKTWGNSILNLGQDAANAISVNQKNVKQIAVTTFIASLYVTLDSGKHWDEIISSGKLK